MIQPYSSRYNRHRSGQALLLAVLVMVFAALIGVTFITVVASNIGQTGREEERNKARQAAEAGLAFANLHLTNSVWGTRWDPANSAVGGVTPPLNLSDVTYTAYWTPFDQAQGWNSAGFAKFPDPRSVNPSNNAPNYLLKVERVLETDADNELKDKTGALRITSIGLSTDDPTAYYKVVAYKGGPAQSPGTRGAMEVTNWDFNNETVPMAQVATGSGTTLDIINRQGDWPPVPFSVVRGDPAHGGTVERHTVVAVSGNTLTLSSVTPITTAVAAGERVEVAATLGAPLAIDFNADGTPDTTDERVDFHVSKDAIPSTTYTNIPGSTYVNGGLIWEGNSYAQRLLAPRLATVNAAPGTIKSSGLMLSVGTTTVDGTADNNGVNSPVTGQLRASNGTGTNTFPLGTGSAQELQLVEDGWNRLGGAPDPTRQVKPFTPPNITVGSQGFGRYRQLTKYSLPNRIANPGAPNQASAYGYGQGIYINNPQDRERKRTGSPGRYTDMTQEDLMALWYSNDTSGANKALRMSEPATTLTTDAESGIATLEEMHLRGWIAPNEFMARGALIELDPANAKVYITLDSRNDGRTTSHANGASTMYPYQGSIPEQGWRTTNGTLEGDASVGGVYRKELDWPANGVIFAEGNIRVRGGAFDASGNTDLTVTPPRSLTIVSMNNIYIEGSLNAGARKVYLAAKKNVVMNPTAAIQKAEAQTRLSAAATGTDIAVYDATSFLPGDEVVIGAVGERRMVVSIVNDQTLRLDSAPTGGGAGEIVKLVDDPTRGGTAYAHYATRITQFSDAVQRRFYLDGANPELRLAIRHSAQRRDALRVTTQQATGDPAFNPPLSAATITNKLARNAQTTIIQADHMTAGWSDKQFDLEYTDAASSGNLRFPDPVHADDAASIAYPVGNNSTPAAGLSGDLNNARTSPQWRIDTSVLNNYDQTANRAPAHFLAAVGNKPEIDPATASGAYPNRQNVFVGTEYVVPMATSILMKLNGADQTFRNDYYNTVLGNFEFVKQFGFNFDFGSGTTGDFRYWEDVISTDQTFYRNGTGGIGTMGMDNVASIIDSRVIRSSDTTGNDFAQGWNTLAFKFDPRAESYFEPTNPSAASGAFIPYYRLSRLKFENANMLNGDHEFENLQPGYNFDVRAYIYAQEGSWLVLSGGYYDENIRTDGTGVFLDLPDATGAYNGTRDPGENADLNRDGVESRAEQAAVYRYRRYNYQVNVTGGIMQKTTPIITDPDGTGPMVGYVSDWMDKWATVKIDSTNFPSTTGAFSNNLSYTNGNFATISYTFDPSAALGVVDSDLVDEDRNNNGVLDAGEDLNGNGRLDKPGFRPPVSPELIYQTG